MSSERRQRRGIAPSWVHLRRLTDDTGLLEHALGRIPRRQEGYTTDDNARALWIATEWLSAPNRGRLPESERSQLISLADTYLAFLLWTQGPDGWFHNNIAYDRTPEPEAISHDCQGRAVWSCADAWVRLGAGQRETAFVLMQHSIRTLGAIESMRGRAFAMAACAHLLEAADNGVIRLPRGWEAELRHHLVRLERILTGAFRQFSRDDGWRWFEPVMTYGNGVLPWAMLKAFRVTRRAETLEIGLDSLSSLQEAMTAEGGCFRPIGNESWRTRDSFSRWDQQPLEMFKLALALEEGARAMEAAQGEGVSLLISATSAPEAGGGGLRPQQPEARAPLAAGRHGETRLAGGAAETRPAGAGPAAAAVPRLGGECRLTAWRTPRGHGADELLVGMREHAAALRAARDRCLAWFHGDNDLHVSMVDPLDGSCCDGLQEDGPNMNCGAEATLSYLMTQALCDD